MSKEIFDSLNEKDTFNIGKQFARRLKNGDIVAIYGDLGAGKTEFVKGICNYFDVDDIVTSPTFTIMNHYGSEKSEKPVSIYHIDLYRLKNDKEIEDIGLDECLISKDCIKIIEWAEKANGMLPENRYNVFIHQDENSDTRRTIEIEEK